jgi:hypothetical protein
MVEFPDVSKPVKKWQISFHVVTNLAARIAVILVVTFCADHAVNPGVYVLAHARFIRMRATCHGSEPQYVQFSFVSFLNSSKERRNTRPFLLAP